MNVFLSDYIGPGVGVLVDLIIIIHLIRSYLRSREESLGFFTAFLTSRFLFFLSACLASLIYSFSENLLIPAILIVFLWIMIFISLIFPPLLFCNLKWPQIRNVYVGAIAALGVIGSVLTIVNFSSVQIDPQTGMAFVFIPQSVGICYLFAKLFGVLPLAILFLSYMKGAEKRLKIRSFLIGFGLLWLVSTAFVPQYLATIGLPIPLTTIYACFADILIFAGVIYRVPSVAERETKII